MADPRPNRPGRKGASPPKSVPARPPLSGATPDSPVFGLVHVLAWLTTLIGVAMIVLALANNGGVTSYGVLVGALFAIAGGLRLRLLRGQR